MLVAAVAGCASEEKSAQGHPPLSPPADSEVTAASEPTAAASAQGSATASASAAATASASASAAAAPPPAPRPAAERPSASFERPAGQNKVQWQRVFDMYGRLLDVDDLLDDFHHRHPDTTRVFTIAKTHQGRNVRAILIADRPDEAHARPSVLLNGMHHGDEPLSGVIVLDAIESLLEKSKSDAATQRQLSELAIWCVPVVNPDGFVTHLHDFGAGRKNGRETDKEGEKQNIRTRGVDLNRNYPFRWGFLREAGSRSKSPFRSYRGPEPASEPEVRALVEMSDREHFVASLSYHIGTVALLAPYTIDGVPNPEPNEAWTVAKDITRGLRANGNRPVYVLKNLYPVDGTDQDYHRGAHGTLALLFEASARSWEEPSLVDKTLKGIRPLWRRLFDRYLDGPSVEGHVRDAAGKPLSAEVQILEMKPQAGEVWRSRCRDGFFGRYLPAHGRFTVRVIPAGGAPIDTPVEVSPGKGRAVVNIVAPEGSGAACPPEGEQAPSEK